VALAFALDATDRDVAAVMAWALPGCSRTEVSPCDLDRFVNTVAHQRVSGLVLEAFDAGALAGWPDETRSRLVDVHLAALRSSLAAEAASVTASELLRSAGVRHAVLKGCATAQLDYPDPALRVTGDVDVLIGRDDHTRAISTLEDAGLHRMAPAFRTGWERRYGKDIALIGDDHVEIDLHLALVAGYFGITMPTAPLLDRLVTYAVADRQMPALDVMGRLLHACIHTASTTPLRLGSAADVVQIAGSGDIDGAEFAAFTNELRCDALAARGLARAWDAFGAEPTELSEWAHRNRPDDRERKALAAFDRSGGESGWLSGLGALRVWKRPGYLVPLLLPSRAHLRHRHRSYLDHLRISARRLSPGRR
jgi:hypothetical protein